MEQLHNAMEDFTVGKVDQNEKGFFIALFAFIRILFCGAYLYFEAYNKYPLHTYMIVNWTGMPWRKTHNDEMEMPDRETKNRIKAMKEWNGFVMLIYSI